VKKIVYTEGPPSLNAGIAGRFILGEPRDIEDDVAALLLAKPMFKEFKPKKVNNEEV
jgi:hypothetical protein